MELDRLSHTPNHLEASSIPVEIAVAKVKSMTPVNIPPDLSLLNDIPARPERTPINLGTLHDVRPKYRILQDLIRGGIDDGTLSAR